MTEATTSIWYKQKLCAEALGIEVVPLTKTGRRARTDKSTRELFMGSLNSAWSPITNDGQAMLLAKRFGLIVDFGKSEVWEPQRRMCANGPINGAIVDVVSRMKSVGYI